MNDITTLGLAVDSTQVVRARDELGRFVASGNKAADAGTKMEASWLKVKGVLAGLALGATVVELVKLADSMTLLDARLKLAVGSSENFTAAQKEIYRIAQQSNAGVAETAQLFTKLYDPVKRAGGGIKETSAVVEAFAATLRVGGASAQEAASATLQFAQAMASGKLQGDEFKAISETSPRFLKAIAEGMNVPIEKLKEMGSEGKLTADVLGNALVKELGKLKTEMKSLPDTVGGAMTRLTNDFKLAVNDINKASGTTLGLANTIEEARKLVPAFKAEALGAMEGIGKWLESNKGSMSDWWRETKGLLGDLWEIVKAGASIVGWITSSVNESGALTTVLQTARLILAGFKDGVEFLGGAFATLGSLIMQVLVTPLTVAGKLAAEIAGAFDEELGQAIRSQVDELRAFAESGARYGDDVAKKFADGKTNVAALSAEFERHGQTIESTNQATQSQVRALDNASEGYKKLASHSSDASKDQEKLKKAYDELRLSIAKKISDLEEEATLGRELTAAEKERNEFIQDLKGKYKGLSEAQQERVAKMYDEWDAAIKLADSKREGAKALKEYVDAQAAEYEAAERGLKTSKDDLEMMRAQIANMREQLAGGNKYLDHVNALNAARQRQKGVELERKAIMMEEKDGVSTLSQMYRNQAKSIYELADAMEKLPGLQLLKEFDDLLDPNKPKSFGDALNDAFAGAGSSLVKMSNLLEDFTTKQAKLSDLMKKIRADKTISQEDRLKRENALIEEQGELGQETFFTMVGAAKGFFKEGSEGYKVLQAAETGWRTFQLASDLVKGISAAKVAIASQGQGEPYTAWARMAAMAAAMATLGFAVSGGFSGGGSTGGDGAKQATGQGTVFGDAKAKSESIENSINTLEDTAQLQLRTQTGMLAALRSIEAAIGGVTNQVLRSGLTSEDPSGRFGIRTGTSGPNLLGQGFTGGALNLDNILFGGKITNALFGKKTKITGTGLSAGAQNLGDIISGGLNLQEYADVNTTRKFFGIKVSNSNSTNYQSADKDLQQQFSLIFKSFYEAVGMAGKELGANLGEVQSRLNDFVVNIGKIDLTGLTGEQIQEKLTAVLGAAADDIAQAGLPGLDAFRKVGEGYFETLVRVASGVETANYQLELLGITAIDYTDIVKKQGDVATEVVRQSIVGYETLGGVVSSVGEIISTLDGESGDLVETYEQLVEVRSAMKDAGLGSELLTVELIRAAGGLDKLQSSLETYYDKFFTEEEKVAMGMSKLTERFGALGLAVPESHEAFRKLVDTLSKDTTPAGQALMVKVIELAGSFHDAVSAADDLASSTTKMAASAADAMVTLTNGSQMTRQAFAAKAGAVTEADIRAAYGIPAGLQAGSAASMTPDQMRALSQDALNFAVGSSTWLSAAANSIAMGTAGYNDPSPNYSNVGGGSGGSSAADAQRENTQALLDLNRSLRDYIDNLLISDNSILSPEQKLEEAKSQFDTLAQLAFGGDRRAYQDIQGAADSLIRLSREAYGTSQPNTEIFNNVVLVLEKIHAGIAGLEDATVDGIKANADGQQSIVQAAKSSSQLTAEALEAARLASQRTVGFEQ